MDIETITITRERLAELEEKEMRFMCLEHAGVDNWEGYCNYLDIYDKWLADNTVKKMR